MCGGTAIDEHTHIVPKGVYPRVCGGTYVMITAWKEYLKRVYPRVCGGTQCRGFTPSESSSRSIPACAGEPLKSSFETIRLSSMVYPRVCGGTFRGFLRRGPV